MRRVPRYLHEHPRTRFPLILVGGDGCWEVLSCEPMLRSQIFRRVNVTPLNAAQVCELKRTFHPIDRDVDPEILLLFDDQSAHGNLRNWVSFTHSAAALCRDHGHGPAAGLSAPRRAGRGPAAGSSAERER